MATKAKPKKRRYAEGTRVPVSKTQTDLRKLLTKEGAIGWSHTEFRGRATIAFQLKSRLIRFEFSTPADDEAEERRCWRALLLCIKAKLEIVNEGIEPFEDVFLANFVTKNGATVGQRTRPVLDEVIDKGITPLKLLLSSGE